MPEKTAAERGCLSDEQVLRLCDGAASEDESFAAQGHIVECAACRGRIAARASGGAEDTLRRGDVVDGKYRIERLLGGGGMGMVVAAHHLELDTRVALKFMLAETLADPDLVRRFSREARAAARLKSEHVARIHDVGKLPSGAPYFVMEYFEGHDIASLLAEHRVLPVDEAVRYTLQACEAIAEAHACGIIHRDLKPQNIFVTAGPRGQPVVKVLDFGLAKVEQQAHPRFPERSGVTRAGALLGTPCYMAPEQLQDASSVDARVDIWALGACLYEMLAGRRPFTAPSWPLLSAMILLKEPTPLRELRREVPEALARAVHRCLAKSPDERFATIDALVTALTPFQTAPPPGTQAQWVDATLPMVNRPRPLSAPTSSPATAEAVRPRTPSERPRPEPDASKPLARRFVSVALALVLLVGSALVAAFGYRACTTPAARPPSTTGR